MRLPSEVPRYADDLCGASAKRAGQPPTNRTASLAAHRTTLSPKRARRRGCLIRAKHDARRLAVTAFRSEAWSQLLDVTMGRYSGLPAVPRSPPDLRHHHTPANRRRDHAAAAATTPPPPPGDRATTPPPPRCDALQLRSRAEGEPHIWPLTPSIARWVLVRAIRQRTAKPRDCPVAAIRPI